MAIRVRQAWGVTAVLASLLVLWRAI